MVTSGELDSVAILYLSFLLVTLVATRVTVIDPARVVTSTDGMFTLAWRPVSPLARNMSAAVAAIVRPGSPARVRSIRPDPWSKTPAGDPSPRIRPWWAVVMRADLIWPGVQAGCRARRRAAAPVTWGAAIEVPAMAW